MVILAKNITGNGKQYKLEGLVHIDELLIDEYEEGKTGYSADSKKKLEILALEILEEKGGVSMLTHKYIERASCKEFRPFF